MSNYSTPQPGNALTIETQTIRKLFLRLLPFLFLLYIVAYLDRINVSFAILQMRQQFDLSDKVYGRAAGIFFAGYFLFQVPSNLLLERIGVRKWISALMIVWGLISCSMILIHGPISFYSLRFLLGATEAGFFPGMILYMKYWFPAKARAQAVAWFMTANPLAGVIGSPISGALLGIHGLGLRGWQWLFILEALPAVILGFIVYQALPERPQHASWLSEAQRVWLSSELDKESASSAGLQKGELLSAIFSPRIWLLSLVYFGLSSSVYGVIFWLPTAIKGLEGLSNRATGLATTPAFLLMAVVMVLVGMHSDRRNERRWHTALSAFFGAAALIAAVVIRTPLGIIVGMSLGMIGGEAMCGPFWAMATKQVKENAAAGIAIINSIANWGGYFGPFVIGAVRNATGKFEGGLLAIAGVLFMSGIIASIVGSEKTQTAV